MVIIVRVVVDEALNVAGFVIKVIQRVRRAAGDLFGQNPCAVENVSVVARLAGKSVRIGQIEENAYKNFGFLKKQNSAMQSTAELIGFIVKRIIHLPALTTNY